MDLALLLDNQFQESRKFGFVLILRGQPVSGDYQLVRYRFIAIIANVVAKSGFAVNPVVSKSAICWFSSLSPTLSLWKRSGPIFGKENQYKYPKLNRHYQDSPNILIYKKTNTLFLRGYSDGLRSSLTEKKLCKYV